MKAIMGLNEDLNQADKIYFKSGVLSPEVREAILNITGGDNFTRLVTSAYSHFSKFGGKNRDGHGVDRGLINMCEDFYDDLCDYDKNLFPIQGNLNDYGDQKPDNNFHVLTLMECLKARNALVYQWSQVPDLLKRNLIKLVKNEIYQGDPNNDHYQDGLKYRFNDVAKTLKTIVDMIKNLSPEKYDEIVPKLFSSNVKTLADVKKGAENLQKTLSMLSSGMGHGKEDIIEIIEGGEVNANIVSDRNNILIVKINDAEAMQSLGCFSSWCFAVPGGDAYWDQYAGYGHVYIIYDFNTEADDARFMMVYLPDTGEIYLSNNIPYSEAYEDQDGDEYLRSIGVDTTTLR